MTVKLTVLLKGVFGALVAIVANAENPGENDIIVADDPLSLSQQLETTEEQVLEVPFTAQAPSGNWVLPYEEACEETSILMVEYFWKGKDFAGEDMDQKIAEITEWAENQGYALDTGVTETAEIAEQYLDMDSYIYFDDDASIENIKSLLSAGFPVIIPVAGRDLGNPNFVGLGPPYHMLVLIGYDDNGFIANDPGTRLGGGYRYSYETIDAAIHDWHGSKENIHEGRKAILVLVGDDVPN